MPAYRPKNLKFEVVSEENDERTIKATMTTPRDKLILDEGKESEREIHAYRVEHKECNIILYELDSVGFYVVGNDLGRNPHMRGMEELDSVDCPKLSFNNPVKKESISPKNYETSKIEKEDGEDIEAVIQLEQEESTGIISSGLWHTKEYEVLEFENGIIKNL